MFKRHVIQKDFLSLAKHAFGDEYFICFLAFELRDQILPGNQAGHSDGFAEKVVDDGFDLDFYAADRVRSNEFLQKRRD